jgi:mannosyltransferase OCH1-like enzyme
MRLHPDWRHVIVGDFDYELIRAKEEYPDFTEYVPLEDLWDEKALKELPYNWHCFYHRCLEYRGRHHPKAIATDFIRACLLYCFGGFVLDWDMYALRPFDRFVNDDIVFARIKSSLVSEAVMAARPKDKRVRDVLVKYVKTQYPETGTCCLNLSAFVDEQQLPAYDPEWFIPHRRNDDGTNLYRHTENTHAIHLWRQQEYDFARLEDIARLFRGLPPQTPPTWTPKPCGCYRAGKKVEC